MASTFSIISTVFLTTGVLFFLQGVALVVIYVVKWRGARTGMGRGEDQANMMILFQSMRDLLHEQKQLARQFNEDIDRKLTRINLVVHDALDAVQRPGSRSSLAATSPPRPPSDRDARNAFLREARKLSGQATAEEPLVSSGSSSRKSERITPQSPAIPPQSPEGFRAVAEDEDAPGQTGERFDAWVGLDFGGDSPNPYRVEVPEQAPAAPEDADKAREAFRSLLDMHHEARTPAAPAGARPTGISPGLGGTPTEEPSGATNGARKATPLQRRVQEYADAGMSVPQIARELGIGKGEVRLILSLREGRKV